MGSLHPFLKEYLSTTEDGLEVIEKMPASQDALLAALLRLFEARALRIPFDEALAEADRVTEEEHEANLYLFFVHIWAVVSLLAGRLEQARALIRRGEGLLSDEILPELRALIMVAKSAVVASGGDHAAAEHCADEAVRMWPSKSESPRYGLVLLQRALWRARRGRGVEAEVDLEYLAANQAPGRRPGPNLLNLTRFIDHVATGRAAEAAELLEKIDINAPGPVSKFVAESKPIVDLMLGKGNSETAQVPAPEKAGTSVSAGAWVASAIMLQRRKPKEALDWARRLAGAELGWAGFPSCALIRAELACGHGAAARRLLRIKEDKGGAHYFDDLFLARIELLAGNREAAGRYFAAVLKSCDYYRARAMLDFELSLACELSAGDLIELGGLASRVKQAPAQQERSVAIVSSSPGVGRLVGSSAQLADIREAILRFAPHDAPVLICGETGTGKELVSRALHEEGPRRGEPFLAVNCGAISDSLLESELFGHERGAFSGAERAHQGFFEEAGAGTLLLDEIGEISPRLQVALLRVLESSEIRPVGSSRSRGISCRVIAATNADLEARVAAGTFRRDLLYRLMRLEINVPPLRERPEDILPLADHFLSLERPDGCRPQMSEELKAALRAHSWPGNIRELRNVIEKMRLLNSDKLSYEADDVEFSGAKAAPEDVRKPAPAQEQEQTANVAGAQAAATPSVAEILRTGNSSIRRRERLRELFREHRVLTRSEVVKVMGMAPATATRDLRALCAEGLVEKVEPSRSPRTHYFQLREQGS
jgi:two-component system, NtrC family, response regulator AtoC